MKLPKPRLDIETRLREFDVWITPSLGEIRDTDQFRTELDSVAETFERMGEATGNFAAPDECRPGEIARAFVQHADGLPFQEAAKSLEKLASILFLVTGKSDNNSKCQLPLYLRDQVKLTSFPAVVRSKRRNETPIATRDADLPRVLTAEKYMEVVAALKHAPRQQTVFLNHFVRFLLSDDKYVSQLWSIGRSYFALKPFGKERDFLSPLVVFKIRGSVAASGGHDPEALLRNRLVEWGLQPGVDFNLADVPLAVLKRLITGREDDTPARRRAKKAKTRAYDFVLPYQTPGRRRRILIQAQFYAGDSGSVSHKNVDQTASSREAVRSFLPDAVFVEYVDGAGYFSSLNGDLESLLEMVGSEFVQIRSAPIRLRRELQHAGFLTPLEIQHAAVCAAKPTRENVAGLLRAEGYSGGEIGRALEDSLQRGFLTECGGKLTPRPEYVDTVRRYLLLDVAALKGANSELGSQRRGLVMVPGYGPFHGIDGVDLIKEAKAIAPGLASQLSQSELVLGDIDWLRTQRMSL